MTDQSIVCLIRLKLLCYNTSSYLLSTTSRKDRAFPHLIYSFTNTYMVTKTPRYLSLLSKYARILCRCPYTSLLHKSRLPPIIHNIPSTTLHTSFHHSIKTQNLPQFTTFLGHSPRSGTQNFGTQNFPHEIGIRQKNLKCNFLLDSLQFPRFLLSQSST